VCTFERLPIAGGCYSLVERVCCPPCVAFADYPSYPLLGNRLVPFTFGSTTITAVLNNGSASSISRAITVTTKDTYLPTWPAAAAVSDTSMVVRANMTEAFTVTYQLVPSAQLDLVAVPPAASEIDTAGGGEFQGLFVLGPHELAAVHACSLLPKTARTSQVTCAAAPASL
jgi:hypothetical protein